MPRKQPEQLAWDTFKRNTDNNPLLRFWRIENQHGDGMSDVYGRNRNDNDIWLEFKALAAWPKRASTFPLKDSFEPGQIPFLKEITFWGGLAYVILRVREWDEWFLIHPKCNVEIVDMTRADIERYSAAIGLHNIIKELEQLK